MEQDKSKKILKNDDNTQKINKSHPKAKSNASLKPDFRLLFILVMTIFVLFVMGWGACQRVKDINMADRISAYNNDPGIKKVEDNSQNAGKSIDMDALVKRVLDKVAFEAELNKLDDSVAEGMVETTEGTKLQIYLGNGTFADELIVMTAKNESDAKQNQESIKLHLADSKKSFENYNPKEAKKIEQAVSIRCGCYVIVCITSDYETAEETINAFIRD